MVYPLDEVLLLALLAVLAGADGFTDFAWFGVKTLALLRRFRPFADGTPPHDTLGDIFASLDPRAFQRCFVRRVAALTKTPAEVIAIDGKTLRRYYQKKGAKDPIHMVSAFAARQRRALAQVKVSEKSSEIVAIPALLDMMQIEGAVITIDAMGCQRAMAKKIRDKKADYIIALKGNQGTLREDVEIFAAEQRANGFKESRVSRHETVDGDHGRIETRKYTMIHDVGWLRVRHNRPGLESVVIVESQRESDEKILRETRDYITWLALPASALGPMIRDHWMGENGLHCYGHDVPRRRMADPSGARARQRQRPAPQDEQPLPEVVHPGLHAPHAENRRLARRIPPKPHRGMSFPWSGAPMIGLAWP